MSIVNKRKGKARSLGLSLVYYGHVAYWYIEDSFSRLDVYKGLLEVLYISKKYAQFNNLCV